MLFVLPYRYFLSLDFLQKKKKLETNEINIKKNLPDSFFLYLSFSLCRIGYLNYA